MDNIAQEIKKPVEAIQCKNTFSLLQRKMYNVLLANAAGNLRPDVTHKISIGTLCKLMGYKSNDYKTIKVRFRELRRMDIEWDIINENGNNVWTTTSPLSLARVIEGEGICEYEFANGLIPYLDRPAQYAKFSLAIQSKFKSSYGLALYENCERYRKIGYTKSFDVNTFRKLMGVNDDEYLEFFALKRRVIDKAIQEVNEYAAFDVKPEYKKKGKQVVEVKFLIDAKSVENQIENSTQISNESELHLILKQVFILNDKKILELFKSYGASFINEKVTYVFNTSAYKSGTINNLAAYLITAINNDFKISKSSKEVLYDLKQKKSEEDEKIRRRDELIQETELNYSAYMKAKLLDKINRLELNEKQLFNNDFEKYLETKNTYSLQEFKKKGLSSMLVFCFVKNFIEENYPSMLENIQGYEDYVSEFYPALVIN